MFPEIVRDDVFRLETQRLWLRWPSLADAVALADIAAHNHAQHAMVRHIAQGASDSVLAKIARWRAEFDDGSALHFVIEDKSEDRSLMGLVHLRSVRAGVADLDYCLHPSHRGHGFMIEAVQALLDLSFLTSGLAAVHATPLVVDPAGRRVIERCGFTFVATGMSSRAGSALAACDQFSLSRKTWQGLKSWALPGYPVAHGLVDAARSVPEAR